ncbi:MAG: DUF2225 domain-containing protein [Candidatus Helarchaeota archaeon]
MTCSVCGTGFESQEISSCGFASKRTDFRPNFWGFNPAGFFYHLCPNCGFCAGAKIFEKSIDNPEFKEKIMALGPLEDNDLSEKLERSAICLEIMVDCGLVKPNDFMLANAWIEPYWWAKSDTEIKKFGKMVVKYFERAFEKGQVPEKHYLDNTYLLGEIYRRIGEQEKAVELFDKVISEAGDNEDLKKIRDLAIQQKLNPKENL